MAAAWQSAPIVEHPEQRPQQGSQPAWMSAPAVDEAPAQEAPRGLQMPEPEVASAEPAEEPAPSRQPRGLLGVPAGSFTAEAQVAASEPVERYPGWEELAASDAFQQAGLRQRHDLRAEFFRDNVAAGLEGEERREAERAFHRDTGPLGHEAEPRGLQTWESGSTGRRPTESMEDARERAVEIGQPGEDGELPLGEEMLRGLQNAGRGVMESFYGTQAMWADDEEERQRLLDKARELRAVSEQNQATMPNFTEIRSPGDAARWAIHGIGAMAPSVGSIMAGGAAGGKVGGMAGAAAGPKGAALGAIAGSTIGSFSAGYMLYAGGLYSDIRQQGGEHEAARNSALKWGAPASAVSIVMPMAFLGSVSGYLGKDFVRGRARNMLIGAGLGGVGEGSAEAMAEAFTIMGEEEVLGRTLTDEERRSRIINAGAAGGLMGTSMGAVGGGVQQQGNLDTMLDGFIADMERAYSEGASEDVRQAVIATLESADSLTGNQQAMLDYLRTEQADSNRPLNQELKEVQEIALSVYQRDDATNLARFTELAEKQANGQMSGTEGLELIALQVNSPGVRDALSQEAAAQIEGDPAAQQQATQDIADWEAQWREHEQHHDLAPIDLQQDTGISATVSPAAPEAGGQESAGLQGVSEAGETAAPVTDDVADLLRAAPAANEPAAITRARESLVAGDSFAFMQSRAEGNPEAAAALEQMQQAMVEAEQAESPELAAQKREEAASAYLAARDAMAPAQPGLAPQQEAVTEAPQPDTASAPAAPQQAPDQPSAEPGRLRPRVVPVEQIQVDPQAYQFRTEVNERGVDSRLDGVREWDDLRAGNIVLHERTDGRVFVADGHHRVDLARQLEQSDVNAIVLREADGVTVEDARRWAAEANIAAGSATAIDAAKVFRDSEGSADNVVSERNLPRTQLVRDGADIARLDTEAFGAVLNKVVSEKDGAAIGRAFTDADQQLAAIDIFRQVQPQNDNQRALLVNEIRQAGFAQGQSDQMGMFGDDPMQSLIGERVRVMDRLRQELSRDRRLFATLNNNAQTAEAAGNRIATERNEQLSDTAAQAIALLERATTTPEINQQINDAARRVSEGEPVAPVVRELKEALLRGPDTEADQRGRSPAPGQRQADQAGQEPGGSEQVSGRDDARAARAGEQRLGDGAGEAAAQGVTLKADGAPFQTERAVQLSKRFRDTPGAVAVEVDGGWGFTVPADTQQDAPRRITWQRRSGRRVWDGSDGTVIADHSIGSTKTFMAFADNGAYDRGENFATGDTLTEAKRLAETAPRPGQETAQPDVDAADTSARRVEETAADRQVEAEPAPAESLTLETQTEESLAAREQETQAAEQAEAEQRRQEAERAQADRDADDFLLTGSDTTADQAMARGQDSLFRLEPPSDVAARRDAMAEAIGQHPELAGVQPVARVGELPATVQITMLAQGIDPRSVRGVFVDGELYVVAENVADTAEGVRVAVHEAVGHRGVREVLGDRLTPAMNQLYLSFPRDHEIFQQVRERYPHIDTRTPEGRQEFAEELVAHLAETNPQVSAWQRFVARVRDLLRQVFPEVAWTENDVRALIQRSRETLTEQALADGTVVAGSPRFAIAPPTDSQAFREWFGDSQVVDKSGDPLVVYHGTKGDFSEFRGGARGNGEEGAVFFSPDPTVGSLYAGWTPEGVFDNPQDGSVMPVYLRITNPLVVDFQGGKHGRGEAIQRARDEGHDGVLLKNHYDAGGVQDQWVAFSPEQVKSVFNQGTFDPNNPDIRFSLSEAPQQPRLSAIHNISADGLAYADQMGGLAVPSIGVITEQAGGVEGFGEITLIGRRGLADPAQEAVFSADAYTVRFPRPEFDGYREADYRRLREQLEPYAERFDSQTILATLREHGKDAPDARELVNRMLNSSPVMAMYLESQGQEAQPVMRAADPGEYAPLLSHPALAEWLDANVLADAYVASMDGDHGPMQRFTQALREAYIDTNLALVPEARRERQLPLIEMRFDMNWVGGHEAVQDSRFNEIAREVESLGRRARQEVDPLATQTALQDQIADEPAFKQWVEETFVTPMGEPRIKVGRRNMPYTLENIVEAMTRERAIAGREETMTFGAGQARAANAEQFQTLERMRAAAAEQIRSPAEYEAAKAETEALLEDFRERVAGHTTIENYRGQPDTWEGLDGAMRAVARYLGYQRRGRAAFERALKTEKFDVAAIKSQEGVAERQAAAERRVNERREDVQRLQEQLDALDANDPRREPASYRLQQAEKSLARLETEAGRIGGDIIALGMQAAEALEQTPVPYFEAKPQRAVSLDEFAGAVIPEGAPQSVREILDRHGLPYREAPAEQRAQAVHDFRAELDQGGEDVLFNLGDQASRPTAEQVAEGLQGIEGLGRPAVLDTADQLDLDTGLRLTLRGIDPQEVVAFTDDAGRLQVIAGNAESPQVAVSAAVMERIRQQGIASVLGDRLNTIGRRADQATNLDKGGRAVRRAVRAEYPFLDPGIPGDQAAMALEVVTRLSERGDAPTFAVEALQEIRTLLADRLGVTDAADLGRASRAYLDKMLRDYGGTRPPTANGFALSLQDAPGYGTLLDMQVQVIDADGQMISDARLETGFSINPLKNAYRLIASQSDRLRDSGSRPLIELGNRIDRFFDNEDRRLGEINRIMKPALDKMNSGGRRQRKQNARDFEQYWRDWDNGRREAARAIYDGNPAVAAMVDASVELFHETGLENQSVKTPNRTGLWVHDGKRFRKIGKVRKGEFWPRQLRREVQEVIQDPSADQALWRELLDAMVDGGFAKDRQDAATQLRDRDSGRFNEQVSNDYFAGIEKARGEKLPEIFYDYSLDVVRHYGNQWARRISQVEQFGQKLRPTELDAFDEAHKLAADHRTKEYIGQVRNVVYGERNVGMAGTFASNANVLATGLHLTNYATAAQNFMTGSALNVQMFGSQRVLKAYIDLATDFSNLYREGLELGILGKDLMNLMRDAERNNVGVFGADSQTGRFGKIMQQVTGNRMTMSEAIREFTRLGMKYGGYNGTEQLIRANAFVAAKAQLRDALDLWNRSPMSLDARRYRRFMQRNRIDVDALIRENGKGEETARYLRLMVNLPQGSYRADQAPLIIDTQVGRFFGKYQKFGTQTSRLFWQQRIKPFIELMQDASATPAERARAAFDIFHYVGWGMVGGYTNRLVRNTLFGMMFVGPDWDEIIERFRDEDYGLAWAYVLDMAFNNAMSAGSIFGFFGSPMQMAKDFRDGQRVKNPLEPPGLAVFHGMAGLATKFTQQGYSLTGQDVLDAILREYSLPRQIERTAATVADVAGVEPVGIRALDFEIERLQAEMVRRDTNYVRSAARRWADATGIEARQGGSFSPGSTPNTPANNRIHRAIQLGNHAQARALIMEEMRGLSGEEAKQRETSIKATIHARHPLRLAGNTMNQEQRLMFMHWAKGNLPESRYQTIEEVVRNYDTTVQRAGLGSNPR